MACLWVGQHLVAILTPSLMVWLDTHRSIRRFYEVACLWVGQYLVVILTPSLMVWLDTNWSIRRFYKIDCLWIAQYFVVLLIPGLRPIKKKKVVCLFKYNRPWFWKSETSFVLFCLFICVVLFLFLFFYSTVQKNIEPNFGKAKQNFLFFILQILHSEMWKRWCLWRLYNTLVVL